MYREIFMIPLDDIHFLNAVQVLLRQIKFNIILLLLNSPVVKINTISLI